MDERPVVALAYALAASVAFAAMGAFVRSLGHEVGTAETVCARGILGSVVLLIVCRATRVPIRVTSWRTMLVRIVTGTLSLFCYYGAIEGAASDGPGELATANLLLKTAPVWVALGSRVILGETGSRRTWLAVALGIAGAALALAGGKGVAGGRGTVVLGLLSGIFAAGAYLAVRRLATKDDPLAVVTFFSIGAATLTAPFAVHELVTRAPAPGGALWKLAGTALSGTVAQVLMTHAYRHARATIAAVGGLAEVAFALAAAFLIFGERPTVWALAGGGIAFAAGFVASWPGDWPLPRPGRLHGTTALALALAVAVAAGAAVLRESALHESSPPLAPRTPAPDLDWGPVASGTLALRGVVVDSAARPVARAQVAVAAPERATPRDASETGASAANRSPRSWPDRAALLRDLAWGRLESLTKVETDARGRFEAVVPARAGPLLVWAASDAGLSPTLVADRGREGAVLLGAIELRRIVRLTVLVTDGDARAVSGARLELRTDASPLLPLAGECDRDGLCELAAPAGAHVLSVSAPGFLEATRPVPLPTSDQLLVALERAR